MYLDSTYLQKINMKFNFVSDIPKQSKFMLTFCMYIRMYYFISSCYIPIFKAIFMLNKNWGSRVLILLLSEIGRLRSRAKTFPDWSQTAFAATSHGRCRNFKSREAPVFPWVVSSSSRFCATFRRVSTLRETTRIFNMAAPGEPEYTEFGIKIHKLRFTLKGKTFLIQHSSSIYLDLVDLQCKLLSSFD